MKLKKTQSNKGRKERASANEKKLEQQKYLLEKNNWQIRWRDSKITQLKEQVRALTEQHYAEDSLVNCLMLLLYEARKEAGMDGTEGEETTVIDVAEVQALMKRKTVVKKADKENNRMILTVKNLLLLVKFEEEEPVDAKVLTEGEEIPEGYEEVTPERFDELVDRMAEVDKLARKVIGGTAKEGEVPEALADAVEKAADRLRAEIYEPLIEQAEKTEAEETE